MTPAASILNISWLLTLKESDFVCQRVVLLFDLGCFEFDFQIIEVTRTLSLHNACHVEFHVGLAFSPFPCSPNLEMEKYDCFSAYYISRDPMELIGLSLRSVSPDMKQLLLPQNHIDLLFCKCRMLPKNATFCPDSNWSLCVCPV